MVKRIIFIIFLVIHNETILYFAEKFKTSFKCYFAAADRSTCLTVIQIYVVFKVFKHFTIFIASGTHHTKYTYCT